MTFFKDFQQSSQSPYLISTNESPGNQHIGENLISMYLLTMLLGQKPELILKREKRVKCKKL